MSLHLSAELFESDLAEVLSQLLPATVDLDPLRGDPARRWIRIERPHHVDFVPGLGLRLRTSARLQWTALGIAVPVTLDEVELLLRPEIGRDERGRKLIFRPVLGNLDVKRLPSFVDQAIAARVDRALAAEGDMIAWHFEESFAHRVPLPSNLAPVDAFHLGAGDLQVEVTERSLILRLEVTMRFSRERGEAEGAA